MVHFGDSVDSGFCVRSLSVSQLNNRCIFGLESIKANNFTRPRHLYSEMFSSYNVREAAKHKNRIEIELEMFTTFGFTTKKNKISL